jgi:hypothetical protein
LQWLDLEKRSGMAIIAHPNKTRSNFPSSVTVLIVFRIPTHNLQQELLPYTLDICCFLCLHDLEGNHMPFVAAGIIKRHPAFVTQNKKRFANLF